MQPLRWSWLLHASGGVIYHADLADPRYFHADEDSEVEWVAIQQSRVGGVELEALQTPAYIREIPGASVVGAGTDEQGQGGGQQDSRRGVCIMYMDHYYALFSDRGLGEVDFETAAKGFLGIGGDSGLKLYGYARGDLDASLSQGKGSARLAEQVPRSMLQGDVPPLLLPDGLVVTARYGRLPQMQTDSNIEDDAHGQEQQPSRKGAEGGEGALLEVVDPLLGVLREMAGTQGVLPAEWRVAAVCLLHPRRRRARSSLWAPRVAGC